MGVTAEAVCARAGLTKRYFYEAFTDRDELLGVVADDLYDALHAAIVTALDPIGPDSRARATATVDTLVGTLDADARVARLYVESPALPVLLARRDERVDEFADLLLTHVLLLGPGSADRPRHRTAAVLLVSGTTHLVTRWLAGAVPLSRAGLVEEITRAGMAALDA
ncbi:TetR/AcrR family transcriptional regulator [Actinomycetospora sp. OC33-EN08]|uniref:TetR/AcrR family transcriptional regulator n=1 Tax=Actinomycetospora aurantiaca TaxID=3129233 RepID=A0ABU8MIV1_9PSEU